MLGVIWVMSQRDLKETTHSVVKVNYFATYTRCFKCCGFNYKKQSHYCSFYIHYVSFTFHALSVDDRGFPFVLAINRLPLCLLTLRLRIPVRASIPGISFFRSQIFDCLRWLDHFRNEICEIIRQPTLIGCATSETRNSRNSIGDHCALISQLTYRISALRLTRHIDWNHSYDWL